MQSFQVKGTNQVIAHASQCEIAAFLVSRRRLPRKNLKHPNGVRSNRVGEPTGNREVGSGGCSSEVRGESKMQRDRLAGGDQWRFGNDSQCGNTLSQCV